MKNQFYIRMANGASKISLRMLKSIGSLLGYLTRLNQRALNEFEPPIIRERIKNRPTITYTPPARIIGQPLSTYPNQSSAPLSHRVWPEGTNFADVQNGYWFNRSALNQATPRTGNSATGPREPPSPTRRINPTEPTEMDLELREILQSIVDETPLVIEQRGSQLVPEDMEAQIRKNQCSICTSIETNKWDHKRHVCGQCGGIKNWQTWKEIYQWDCPKHARCLCSIDAYNGMCALWPSAPDVSDIFGISK